MAGAAPLTQALSARGSPWPCGGQPALPRQGHAASPLPTDGDRAPPRFPPPSSFLSVAGLSSSSCSYLALARPASGAWAAAAGRARPPPHPPARARAAAAAAAAAGLPAGAAAAGLRLLTPPPPDLGAESPGLGLPRATVIFSPRLSCRHLRPGEALFGGGALAFASSPPAPRSLHPGALARLCPGAAGGRGRTEPGWGPAVPAAPPGRGAPAPVSRFLCTPSPPFGVFFLLSPRKVRMRTAGPRMLANCFSISCSLSASGKSPSRRWASRGFYGARVWVLPS